MLAELADPDYRQSDDALAIVTDWSILPLTDEVRALSRVLVREKVMPGPDAHGDAIHVAVATVHGLEFVVSWNVRHLANLNKVDHLRLICRRLGYVPPMIVTPDNLWQE